MQLPGQLVKVVRTLALVGALGATIGLSALAGLQLAIRTREVPTPDVTGQTLEEANAALAAARGKLFHADSCRQARPAIGAGWTVEDVLGPSKSVPRKNVVHGAVRFLGQGRTESLLDESFPVRAGVRRGHKEARVDWYRELHAPYSGRVFPESINQPVIQQPR